jgi:hypothetical protein
MKKIPVLTAASAVAILSLLNGSIRDFRKKVNAPDMPVVCGALGMAGFKNASSPPRDTA